MIRLAVMACAALLAAGAAQAGCGARPEPCQIENGEYHAALPPGGGQAPPVVLFLHGAGSNGAAVMRNDGLVKALLDRGYAVLAPSGSRRFGSGAGRSWNFYPGWDGRDEAAFLHATIADAAERMGTAPDKVLLAGFSAGGFMVNYLACSAPGAFAAFAPVSGGFWRPHPETCTGPVRLFHTHGWRDTTVPLEGRFLGGGRYQQGDIMAGLEIWRTANGCADQRPDGYDETGPFLRRRWDSCDPGSALELALFPGGHMVPRGWADMVLDWFEGLPPAP